jgi:hypothetical protein
MPSAILRDEDGKEETGSAVRGHLLAKVFLFAKEIAVSFLRFRSRSHNGS